MSPPQADGATASPRTSYDARRSFSPAYQQRPSQFSPPPLQHPQPQRAWSGDGIRSPVGGMGDYFNALGAREGMVSEFDTSVGIRLDFEACLAYLAFPPVGAILLLILERKSDYVRYVQTHPAVWLLGSLVRKQTNFCLSPSLSLVHRIASTPGSRAWCSRQA